MLCDPDIDQVRSDLTQRISLKVNNRFPRLTLVVEAHESVDHDFIYVVEVRTSLTENPIDHGPHFAIRTPSHRSPSASPGLAIDIGYARTGGIGIEATNSPLGFLLKAIRITSIGGHAAPVDDLHPIFIYKKNMNVYRTCMSINVFGGWMNANVTRRSATFRPIRVVLRKPIPYSEHGELSRDPSHG